MFTTLLHGVQAARKTDEHSRGYDVLVELFQEWRAFERPPLKAGVPDYSAQHFDAARKGLTAFEARLQKIQYQQWPTAQQIDWQIVQAEMKGFDFNLRVLQPWARDPAFYQTVFMEQADTPAREGPTNHVTCEVWQYRFPLSTSDQAKMAEQLAVIAPLLAQARVNLTGNARDLWVAGIRNFEQQSKDLQGLHQQTSAYASEPLAAAIAEGMRATAAFSAWLQAKASDKTGPSGVGKENYTWYQQHVHLVPLSWDQEVDLLQRELDRAWANLKLEEQRNAALPAMQAAATPAQYDAKADAAVTKLMQFLSDRKVMPIKANMAPAAREHLLAFVPEDQRNFFDIGRHYDPLPLFCHWYHWFDLAQVRDEPHASLIRRGPLLYNIWDSRNEGIATGVEEMFMHMGLHDDSPRSREIVWIMLAQRAARGLGSLYAHANMMTMEEASQVHLKWTPRNWMRREPELLKFEQHLYLRQPGYGTSYVVGKYLIERGLAQRAKQLESQDQPFVMEDFFRVFNDAGNIPVVLTLRQITDS